MTKALATQTADDSEPSAAQIIKEALAHMNEAADHLNGLRKDAYSAALAFGANAKIVKDTLGRGEFGPWAEKHFGPDTRRPFTVQWIRKCIRAATVLEIAAKKDQKKLMLKYPTVEKLGALVEVAKEQDGKGLLDLPDEPAKEDRRTKAARASLPAPPPGNGEAAALDKRAKALDAKEKALDAKETALAAWEARLEERERNLALQTAHLPTEVADAAVKPQDSGGLDEARQAGQKAEARRAAQKAAKASRSAAKPEVKGEEAPEGENASSEPEDSPATSEEAGTADRQFGQPHHGHGSEASSVQDNGPY